MNPNLRNALWIVGTGLFGGVTFGLGSMLTITSIAGQGHSMADIGTFLVFLSVYSFSGLLSGLVVGYFLKASTSRLKKTAGWLVSIFIVLTVVLLFLN